MATNRTSSRHPPTPYRDERPAAVQSVPGGPSEELLDFVRCCIQIFGAPRAMRVYIGEYHAPIQLPADICKRVPPLPKRRTRQ